jgi:hypothetical protein
MFQKCKRTRSDKDEKDVEEDVEEKQVKEEEEEEPILTYLFQVKPGRSWIQKSCNKCHRTTIE